MLRMQKRLSWTPLLDTADMWGGQEPPAGTATKHLLQEVTDGATNNEVYILHLANGKRAIRLTIVSGARPRNPVAAVAIGVTDRIQLCKVTSSEIVHSTLANGLASGKAYNGDVLTIASSPKHHVHCPSCNVLEKTTMPECCIDVGHTSDLHLVQDVSSLKREVKRVADALEELIAINRAKTDSEVKTEVPSEDSNSE